MNGEFDDHYRNEILDEAEHLLDTVKLDWSNLPAYKRALVAETIGCCQRGLYSMANLCLDEFYSIEFGFDLATFESHRTETEQPSWQDLSARLTEAQDKNAGAGRAVTFDTDRALPA